jgi:hypothetical protein
LEQHLDIERSSTLGKVQYLVVKKFLSDKVRMRWKYTNSKSQTVPLWMRL